MIKVKCRGYEGELIRLYANTTEDTTGVSVFATYDVDIKLKPSETVTISEVQEPEIVIEKAE